MDRVILVEQLDRHGRVRERATVRRLPFRIGRGYDCDLILDDPYVSPLHALVERDPEGALCIRDAGAKNGLCLSGEDERRARIDLDGDVSVRLGRSVLRLRSPEHVVPEAIALERRSALRELLFEHPAALIAIPALYLAISLYDQLRVSTSEFEPAQALTTTAWTMVLFGVWIGAWALLNRLLRQRTRIVAHSTVAFSLAALGTLLGWAFEWLHFAVEPIEPLLVADLVLSTAVWSLVLLGHLTVIGVARPARRVGLVAAGFAAILGLRLLEHRNENRSWVVALPYWSRLEPVDPAWLPAESPDVFFAGVGEIEQELAGLAVEAKRERREKRRGEDRS